MAYDMALPSAAELDKLFGVLTDVQEPEQLDETTPEPVAHTYVRPTHEIDRSVVQATSLADALNLHHSRFPKAACKQVNIENPYSESYVEFRPERGDSVNPAKLVCKDCVHIDWCLKYALEAGEIDNIWGGSSGRERRKIRLIYNREVRNKTIDPQQTSLGDYGIENRANFVNPADPKGRKSSARLIFPPSRLEIESANCLDKDSDIFEELDLTPAEKVTKRQLAVAVVSCRTCVFYEYCTEDPVRLDNANLPTVVGGEIQGIVPDSKVPSEQFIKMLTPKLTHRGRYYSHP